MGQGLRALYHGSAIYHLILTGRAPRELALRLDPWPGDAVQGEALLGGEFRFQSEAVRAPSPPWRAGTSEEWRADLQRFQWLGDLAALGSETAWEAARRWTAEWLQQFDIYDRLAWRADVIGDRLFAWLEYFDRLAIDDTLRAAMLNSIARQSRHLAASRIARRPACRGWRRCAALSPRWRHKSSTARSPARSAISHARSRPRSSPMAAMSRATPRRSLRRCAISSMRAPR